VIELAPLLRIGVFLVRPGLLIAVAPAFGGTWAPQMIRVGLTVLLGITCMAVVPVPATSEPVGLVLIMAREAAIGLSLGFGLRLIVAAAEVGGFLAGFQIGFSYSSIVDPQAGVRNGIISATYGLVALMVFFAMDGHHQFLRALVASYGAMPIGLGSVESSIGLTTARMLGLVFVTGVQLAAPVIVVLLIVELGLGLASRAAPMLNLMAQGFPIRLLVGLIALAAVIRVLPPVIRRVVPVALDLASRLAMAFQ
jgi:flagellar biosynthetic protein FliR